MQTTKLLIWLKCKLILRAYRRSKSAIFGAIFMIALFLPLSFWIANLVGTSLMNADGRNSEHILRGVLLGVYAFWIFAPLLGYNLNDSYDITKLFSFPVALPQILTASILGSVFDMPTLLLLPALLSVPWAFSANTFVLLFAVFAITLFLFHTLSLSQSIVMASAGFLRSRKYRDSMAVMIPLISIVYYISSRYIVRSAVDPAARQALIDSKLWAALSYLPPGIATHALVEAQNGSFAVGALYLAVLALLTFASIKVAGMILARIYAGDAVSLRPNPTQSAEVPEAPISAITGVRAPLGSVSGRIGSGLPPAVEAVALKDFQYYRRDPMYRMVVGNVAYLLVIVLFATHSLAARQSSVALYITAWLSALVLLTEMRLLGNIFGNEGGASTLLFLFPSSRKHIILGKNLAAFVMFSALNSIVVGIVAVSSGGLSLLPESLLISEALLFMAIAVGNPISALFPSQPVIRGMKVSQQSATGSLTTLFALLGAEFAAACLTIPIVAGCIGPSLGWFDPVWLVISAPVAALYAFLLYFTSLSGTAKLLETREGRILAKMSKGPG